MQREMGQYAYKIHPSYVLSDLFKGIGYAPHVGQNLNATFFCGIQNNIF